MGTNKELVGRQHGEREVDETDEETELRALNN